MPAGQRRGADERKGGQWDKGEGDERKGGQWDKGTGRIRKRGEGRVKAKGYVSGAGKFFWGNNTSI